MSFASISFRESIRWLPDAASEPTQTIVLSALRSGVFLDVRFEKESRKLDWAFAGYRSSAGNNFTKFTHHIDSRTLNPLDVVDFGTNTSQSDGTTLEVGKMVNPATGVMTAYEEVGRDEESDYCIFVRNEAGLVWRARVGNWQLALGNRNGGDFWAWQAQWVDGKWKREYSTTGIGESLSDGAYLPEQIADWEEGSTVEWLGEKWEVLKV
ncbi:hypothetical protein C8J57DRAFT_1389800 [Mycena rebaudengoi]|nr:hypothetical protein C8J57DRAFT_1389800 [Mycena rebaudengoi]